MRFGVIVVDNGSSDGTAAVARSLGACVVAEPTPGYGAAVHAGIAASTAEYVAVIDGDGLLDPADLLPLLEWVASGRAPRRRPSPPHCAGALALARPGRHRVALRWLAWRSGLRFTTSRQPGCAGATTSSGSVWRTTVSAIPSSSCCAPGALAGPWPRSTSPTTRGPPARGRRSRGPSPGACEPPSTSRGAVVSGAVVVLAKSPVPGVAKTRLAAAVGDRRAADLAAAALLDTLELCAEVFTSGFRMAALAGDLADARRGEELAAALEGCTSSSSAAGVWASGSATRCTRRTGSRAGRWSSSGWTRLTCRRGSSRRLPRSSRPRAAGVGPAADGGWWVLATADPRQADGLADVPMSRPDTYDRTHEAVCRVARRVAPAPVMRDVDTAADAAWAAVAAPRSRFARAWRDGEVH